MTRYLMLLSLALLGPAAAQEFRETIVPNHMIQAVVRDVAQWHNAQHKDCQFAKAIGSIVVEKSRRESTEHWTILACDARQFTYKVTIFSQGGGITDMVSNVDNSPIASGDEPVALTTEECADRKKRFDFLNDKEPLSDEELGEIPQLAADLAACGGAP